MDKKKKFLNITNPEEYFILKNGRELKNIYELVNSLTGMDEETFIHHVNEEKNDFANWIRHIFQDKEFANLVSETKDKQAMIKAINNELSKIDIEKKENAIKKPVKESKYPKKKKRIEKTSKLKRVSKKIKKKPTAKKSPTNLFKKAKKKPNIHNKEIITKIDDILLKEKEIAKREEKIQEIEQRIEKKLSQGKTTDPTESKFFSKEFMQGLATGLLIVLIFTLIYIKFFY